MDILAARKKAAERAKTRQQDSEPRQEAVAEERKSEPAPMRTLSEDRGEQDAALSAEAVELINADQNAGTGHAQEPVEASAPAVAGGIPAAEQPAVEEAELEMLSFQLGSEEYAIPVGRIREVLTPRDITPVPRTPEHILGVCSLRGAVLPIVDLGRRLGLPRALQDERSRIIVAALDEEERIGLSVDRVKGVVRFPFSAIRPVPETVEQGAEFLSGIVRKEERLIILLDVDKTAA
ncbi:MAG: chemotaxis protein CheW [Nitrospirota bacterium]|nr:chemotaxis protein CheW [Nitrospirota bacterium]